MAPATTAARARTAAEALLTEAPLVVAAEEPEPEPDEPEDEPEEPDEEPDEPEEEPVEELELAELEVDLAAELELELECEATRLLIPLLMVAVVEHCEVEGVE